MADVAVVGYAAETVGYVETAAAAAAAVVVGTAGDAAGGYAVEEGVLDIDPYEKNH